MDLYKYIHTDHENVLFLKRMQYFWFLSNNNITTSYLIKLEEYTRRVAWPLPHTPRVDFHTSYYFPAFLHLQILFPTTPKSKAEKNLS